MLHRQVENFDPSLPWLLSDKLLPGSLTYTTGSQGPQKPHLLACVCPLPLLLDHGDHNNTIGQSLANASVPVALDNKTLGCIPCHRDAVCTLAIEGSKRKKEECLGSRAPAQHGGALALLIT
jgi:hypothetical protein